MESLFNYTLDLTPIEVQTLIATNQLSESETQVKPLEMKVMCFHLFMILKKVLYGIIVVVCSFQSSA